MGTPDQRHQTMSDFSSWGGNGALTMKPEITAPGGNIWSVWGANNGTSSPTAAHDQYEIMSGTSMASPQVAGVVAVLKQYIRESGLAEKFPGLTERAIAQSLLMSTAMPLREAATGNYWSIMKQGAGLVDVNAAITARSLIQIVGLPEHRSRLRLRLHCRRQGQGRGRRSQRRLRHHLHRDQLLR